VCPPWTLITVFNFSRYWSMALLIVVDRDWPSRYTLCPPNPRSELCNILLQRTPDSIIEGVYVQTVWQPHRRLDEVGYILLQRNLTVNFTQCEWCYTVFPVMFPVELGYFHLFYPITNYWKYLHEICTCYLELIIFQRALFILNVHYSWKTQLADM